MSVLSDLRILYHFLAKPVRGEDHAARLESFYAGQAAGYDDFRRRLLHGREDLLAAIDVPRDGIWVDMGGGTGSNLELLGERITRLKQIYVVDLSPSLLRVAARRQAEGGWHNATTVHADATTFRPPERYADVVTFSYSLTMIPDWFAAIENAARLLRPGGVIGVVDFYVSRKFPGPGHRRHRWFTRSFWPVWFAGDNVFPSPDHVPFLHRHFEVVRFEERGCKLPYVPLLRMPYYWFVGRRGEQRDAPSSIAPTA